VGDLHELPVEELRRLARRLEEEMRSAAAELRFEEAALLRDEISELRVALAEAEGSAPVPVA
jgi:excinuclease ABC subunit B